MTPSERAQPATPSAADREATRSERGAQARARLKRAARRVLERVGYHNLRIADVTREAGVAAGLFYHYFPDLKTLTIEVLQDFIAESQNLEAIEKDVPRGDWYGRILAHNRLVVHSYAERPGLMRCLYQMADADPAFAATLRQTFHEQLNWLVQQLPRLFPKAELSDSQALLMLYTLGGSAERVLRDTYINRDPVLSAEAPDPEAMAELLSAMFYRGLFLDNPPADRLRHHQYLKQIIKKSN